MDYEEVPVFFRHTLVQTEGTHGENLGKHYPHTSDVRTRLSRSITSSGTVCQRIASTRLPSACHLSLPGQETQALQRASSQQQRKKKTVCMVVQDLHLKVTCYSRHVSMYSSVHPSPFLLIFHNLPVSKDFPFSSLHHIIGFYLRLSYHLRNLTPFSTYPRSRRGPYMLL